MKSLDQIHFMQLDTETHFDPYPFFRLLRETQPVYKEPDYGVYLVTRIPDIMEVNRNSASFSNVVAPTGPFGPLPPSLDKLEEWRESMVGPDRLLTNDPPDHTRYRSLLNRLFTPRRVALIEPRIRHHVTGLIDSFINDSQAEFVLQFAHQLPIAVIGELLGVPAEDIEHFKRLLHEQFLKMGESFVANPRASSRPSRNSPRNEYQAALTEYFARYVRDRRDHPRADATSELATAVAEDGTLFPIETVISMCQLLFAAGGDANTPELLVNGMRLLAAQPQLAATLRENLDLVPRFIEELLRYDTTAMGLFRIAREDTEVGGVRIPKGSIVMVLYASANHDEERFEHGHEFDLDRDPKSHFSFGYGAHHCPGAPIARLEAKVAFEELLRRLHNIRLVEGAQLDPLPSVILRSWKTLPVAFDPA